MPNLETTASPVSHAEFAGALDRAGIRAPFAVALSGGADSMALLALASEWGKKNGNPLLFALHVDHGLREASAREAETVANWAADLGFVCVILEWGATKPEANIQATARDARYRLMGDWMKQNNVSTLLTGHHQDDQAETFLIRLGRGSGLDGLCAMAETSAFPIAGYENLTVARPLLDVSHVRLVATSRFAHLNWLEDPSNQNDAFTRVRLRNLMPALAEAGVTPARIALAIRHLRGARKALERHESDWASKAVYLSQQGYARVNLETLRDVPDDVVMRIVARLCARLGGKAFPPRLNQVEDVLHWLKSAPAHPRARTLSGCRLVRRANELIVARDEIELKAPYAPMNLIPGKEHLWDGRFLIRVAPEIPNGQWQVRPLDPAHLKATPRLHWPEVEPKRIARTFPALWREGVFTAAPTINFGEIRGFSVLLKPYSTSDSRPDLNTKTPENSV